MHGGGVLYSQCGVKKMVINSSSGKLKRNYRARKLLKRERMRERENIRHDYRALYVKN